jgi:hypothetical protein
MATARAQEQQRRFFTLLSIRGKKWQRTSRKEKANRTETSSPLFFYSTEQRC